VLPLDHPFWKDFEERCRERHLENYRKLQGDINRLDPEQIGTFEMVHCSGVLYHMPDPVSAILRLRSVTERYLILSSAVVPSRIVTSQGAELNLPPGCALFVPAIDGAVAKALRQYWSACGVELPEVGQGTAGPWMRYGKDAKKSRMGSIDYSSWWWFFTERALEGMLQTAGFKIVDKHAGWGSRAMSYLCERDTPPLPVVEVGLARYERRGAEREA